MRKILALAMVALLALTFALAAIGCGGQRTEETTTTETAPPTTTDTSMMMPDTMGGMTDTTMHQ